MKWLLKLTFALTHNPATMPIHPLPDLPLTSLDLAWPCFTPWGLCFFFCFFLFVGFGFCFYYSVCGFGARWITTTKQMKTEKKNGKKKQIRQSMADCTDHRAFPMTNCIIWITIIHQIASTWRRWRSMKARRRLQRRRRQRRWPSTIRIGRRSSNSSKIQTATMRRRRRLWGTIRRIPRTWRPRHRNTLKGRRSTGRSSSMMNM